MLHRPLSLSWRGRSNTICSSFALFVYIKESLQLAFLVPPSANIGLARKGNFGLESRPNQTGWLIMSCDGREPVFSWKGHIFTYCLLHLLFKCKINAMISQVISFSTPAPPNKTPNYQLTTYDYVQAGPKDWNNPISKARLSQ